MRTTNYISKKFLQAAFGVVIGLFVLTQAAIIPEKAVDKQEQSDTESQENQQITKPAAVPSSSIQFNLDYQSYLLEEVFYKDEETENAPVVKQILPSAQKALKILFRQIISPNAP